MSVAPGWTCTENAHALEGDTASEGSEMSVYVPGAGAGGGALKVHRGEVKINRRPAQPTRDPPMSAQLQSLQMNRRTPGRLVSERGGGQRPLPHHPHRLRHDDGHDIIT